MDLSSCGVPLVQARLLCASKISAKRCWCTLPSYMVAIVRVVVTVSECRVQDAPTRLGRRCGPNPNEAEPLQADRRLGVQKELKFKEAESKRRKRMTKELGGENAIREQWLIMFSRIEQLHSNVESLQGHSQAALEWATELLGQLTQSIAKKWLGSLVPRRSREQARAEAMLWAL